MSCRECRATVSALSSNFDGRAATVSDAALAALRVPRTLDVSLASPAVTRARLCVFMGTLRAERAITLSPLTVTVRATCLLVQKV